MEQTTSLTIGKHMPYGGKKHMPVEYYSTDEASEESDIANESDCVSETESCRRAPQTSHFRRVRVPHRRFSEKKGIEPKTKKRRLGRISEPAAVRESDKLFNKVHPVIEFVMENTPVRPCGRCRECRSEPCGRCDNCQNNQYLVSRSISRRRCTQLKCSRLTDKDMERYCLSCNAQSEGQEARVKLQELIRMYQQNKTVRDVQVQNHIETQRKALQERLAMITSAVHSQNAPPTHACLLVSLQTLETERDRISRLIERRTTRDPPDVMKMRRNMRNHFGLAICTFAKFFSTDIVASQNVSRLNDIIDKYETLIKTSAI